MNKQNTIFILMDELIAWENIPEEIKKDLKGYQSFKKIGIEFTNIYNNRTVCSSSRSCIMSGEINTKIQDNIDQQYQYKFFPKLSPESDTIAKICKLNNYDITAYFGKQHLDSSMTSTTFITPMLNTNTSNIMNQYGFDKYSVFGDNFYCPAQGILSDLYTWNLQVSESSNQFDWKNPCDETKFIGMLPFLKARYEDKKSFYCEYHITNPHDTQHQIQNFNQLPTGTQLQFGCPFIKEQINSSNSVISPYQIIDNKYINTNRFESSYESYKIYLDKLPFVNSYVMDYVSDSKINSIFPYYVSNQITFQNIFTFPESENDIKSWKNLINTYWGLVIEADNYIFKIYEFLKSNDMLDNTNVIITTDHGDQMSAHGLKQKNFPFRESTNIPLLICSNNLNKNYFNTKSDILGSSIDIAPTLIKLLNLQSNKNKFIGTSLLNFNNNGLIPTNINSDVFHITNGLMFASSYFNWSNWYNNQPSYIQNKVYYNPQNFFEYLSPFTMCITNDDNIQWKFIRYFNIIELIIYNLKYNKKILLNNKYKILFTFDDILNQNQNLNMTNEYGLYLDNLKLILNNKFTFEEGYEAIKKKLLPNDSIELYIYIIFIIYYINTIINNDSWILPGLYSKYYQISNNKNYAFFCYNMSNDPEEIINLADPLYPERHNNELFEFLNNKLNNSIIKYECENFYYNIPTSLLFIILGIFIKYGSNFINYNKNQLTKLITYNFTNNFDTSFDINYIIDSLTL